ncbi:MAG: DUF1566 domain-containing protein [Myxococcales bacterium]|nr:DUF1566 domain-containing protein [Myxococcales bacterium]
MLASLLVLAIACTSTLPPLDAPADASLPTPELTDPSDGLDGLNADAIVADGAPPQDDWRSGDALADVSTPQGDSDAASDDSLPPQDAEDDGASPGDGAFGDGDPSDAIESSDLGPLEETETNDAGPDDALSSDQHDTEPHDVPTVPDAVEDAPPIVLSKTGRRVSRAPGDDGDLRRGLAWPEPRFIDHGDGTLTDRLSGLMWFQHLECLGVVETWSDAMGVPALVNAKAISCAGYDADHDDWRVPTIVELDSLSLIDTMSHEPFVLPDGALADSFFSWSSTSYDADQAFVYHLQSGDPGASDLTLAYSVIGPWPKAYVFGALSLPGLFLVRGDASGPARLWKSGQTTLFQAGDDGDRQLGVPDPSPRFEDLGDGTVRDGTTGLVWLRDAGCFAQPLSWLAALQAIDDLNDGVQSCAQYNATYGDWRLPNRRELFSLMRLGAEALPSGVFLSVQSDGLYWSSTDQAQSHEHLAQIGSLAYAVQLGAGRFERLWITYLSALDRIDTSLDVVARVWPVRGGPILGLWLSSNPLSFPDTAIDSSSLPRSVTVINIGVVEQPLGTLTSSASPFVLDADSCSNTTLAPLASCSFSVIFHPTSAGDLDGTIVVADGTTLRVLGTGGGPGWGLSTDTLDFGSVALGVSKTLSLSISNSGDGPTAIAPTFSIVGADASSFSITQNGCTAALAPNESCQLLITMQSSNPGLRTASLDVSAINIPTLVRTATLTGKVSQAR